MKLSKCPETLEKSKEILKRQEQRNSCHRSMQSSFEPMQRKLQSLGFHCANAVLLFQPGWTINYILKVHIKAKDSTIFFNTACPTDGSIPIITLVGCCKHPAGQEPFLSICDVQAVQWKQNHRVTKSPSWPNSDLQRSETCIFCYHNFTEKLTFMAGFALSLLSVTDLILSIAVFLLKVRCRKAKVDLDY